MNLTPEERDLGKNNFKVAMGVTRRDFLSTMAAGVPAGAFGAAYFGYSKPDKPIKVGLIGGGDEGNILIHEHNPEYLEIVGFSDIRPWSQKVTMKGEGKGKFRMGLIRKYGADTAAKIKKRSEERGYHEDYKNLLNDPEIDMVIVALPLHMHHQATMDALEAGKHVLCEKLMARTVTQCKEMIRKSQEKKLLLSVGHQRHYSVLYDNAVNVLKSGVIGDIRYITAQWHRNNTWPRMKQGKPVLDANGKFVIQDSWKKPIRDDDLEVNFEQYGYKSLEELVRWRLYNRTGGGLMVELGSHQLDASSIFIARGLWGQEEAVHPLAVSGVGVKSFYEDDRECDDHIFVHFEFPGPDHDTSKNREDVVVVDYSSINTNRLENWGETILGSRGSLIVHREQETYLFKEQGPGGGPPTITDVKVTARDGGADLDTTDTRGAAGPTAEVASAAGEMSRGYREEMEHFASIVTDFEPGDYDARYKELRCNGTVAMADAVIALTTNLALGEGGREPSRIKFKEEWFDPASDEAPETDPSIPKPTA